MKYKVEILENRKLADQFILQIHYAKRKPSISYLYGMYDKKELIGVVSYGSPPSPSLCRGIAGDRNKSKVIELNRLVLKYNRKNEASYLVGQSLKLLPKPKLVVSYADTSQNHIGVVYQATNFIYTGLSDKRKEWQLIGSNKHSKTVCQLYDLQTRKNNPDKFALVDRPRKHRYLYILANKTDKKTLLNELNYPIMEYPK